MKKTLIVILAILLTFSLFACKDKTAIDIEGFVAKAEASGLVAIKSGDTAIATKMAGFSTTYTVTYTVYQDEANAKTAFLRIKNEYLLNKGNSSSSVENNLKNYNILKLQTNGMYYSVTRIDSTVVSVGYVPENKKDEVIEFLKSIGY